MKRNYIGKNILVKFLALYFGVICCAATAHGETKKSDTPPQGSSDMAQLVVARTPSVGSGVATTISLDGKDLINLTQGRSYRGALSAGKHAIAVTPHPNTSGQQPNRAEFTAEKGHTYSFKVSSSSGKVLLVKAP